MPAQRLVYHEDVSDYTAEIDLGIYGIVDKRRVKEDPVDDIFGVAKVFRPVDLL